MDLQQFDELARQLSQGESRRRLLGLFGGTALGGLIAAGFASDADAKKRKKKKKKKKKKPTTPTCTGCSECETCQNGACVSVPNGTACSTGACEDGICRGTTNCPDNRICELSEICCPGPLQTANETVVVCVIDEETALACDCVAGANLCLFNDEQNADCCEAGEECNEVEGCVPS
jgi:hypothetical protein